MAHQKIIAPIKKTIKSISLFIVLAALMITASVVVTKTDAQSGSSSIPAQRLVGYAWSETIGWISFNDGARPVTLDAQGNLDGYAWSENIGWVKFGNWSSVPDASLGTGSKLNGTALTGWARAVAGMAPAEIAAISSGSSGGSQADNRGGWDGWISLKGITLTGQTTGNPPTQYFQGYAWGADVVGWVQFDKVGVSSNLNSCIGPYGTVVADGQSFTYYSAPASDGTCTTEDRICINGKLSGSFIEISCGESIDTEKVCSRAGVVIKEGETTNFYSKSTVKSGASCQPFKERLTCKNGSLVNAQNMVDTNHVYSGCRALPGYLEQ